MKNKTKFIYGAALLTLLLGACGKTTSLPALDEEDYANIVKEIKIVNEEVKGNIYLPEEIDDATISWKSSNTDVITDERMYDLAPGVVTRGSEDIKVTLKATISKNGKQSTFNQEVTVKALTQTISEDDYEGYLFGHFISDSGENGEQIYFALAEDGLKFKDLNNRQPVLKSNVGEKGVRDPYIIRSPEGDRFFLIATDLSIHYRGGWKKNAQGYYDPSCTGSHNLVLWQSDDLVNWGEPKLIPVAPENAGMAWAPEMIYDDNAGEYIIFFASSIMNPETKYKAKPNAIYYVATRDFVHFSDTKLFIDNYGGENGTTPREIIDTTIIKIGDTYYSASKDGDNDENGGGIRIMKTENLRDPEAWEFVMNLSDTGLKAGGRELTNKTLEGPEFFEYNKSDRKDPDVREYALMADQYSTSGGYLPLCTTNIEDTTNANNSWRILGSSDYSFDTLKKRHGTVLQLTQEEIQRVKQAYKG